MESGQLKRTVGARDAFFVIVGNIIGIGIFIIPPVVAGAAGEPFLFLGLWLLGGLIAFAGAMSSAELGILMPHAGGDYVFLRKTYGVSWGFLYGYLSFIFSYTGSIATMAVAVAFFQGATLFGPGMHAVAASFTVFGYLYELRVDHLAACALILAITAVNHAGIGKSILLQRIATALPLVFLAGAGGVILFQAFTGAGGEQLATNFSFESGRSVSWFACAAALVPIFFAFTGWNVTLYLAEDIKEPERNIPLSMILSLGFVTLVYMLFCLTLLATIPFETLMSEFPKDVSALAVQALLGASAGPIMAAVIALFIISSLNTTILAGSRLYLAMARDGIFFAGAGKIGPRTGAPYVSLWLQGLWACALILIFREFDRILAVTTVIMLFLSAVTISSVFVLRRRLGAEHGALQMKNRLLSRALGYPFLPAFYIIAIVIILAGTILSDESGWIKALAAALVTAAGFGVYFVWSRLRRPAA